jgi:hypothetical protein
LLFSKKSIKYFDIDPESASQRKVKMTHGNISKLLIPAFFLIIFLSIGSATSPSASQTEPGSRIYFAESGYTNYGEWNTWGAIKPDHWEPGNLLTVDATLLVTNEHLDKIAQDAKIAADGFCLLVTAERMFDADGRFRQGSDEKMSTLLTPTGLAIEGGIQGAVTNRFGYDFRTPVDHFITEALDKTNSVNGSRVAHFTVAAMLPQDLPPGIYRVRLDYGITSRNRYYSLNAETFAVRPFFKGRPTESHFYSAPIPANGTHVSGRFVDASMIVRRLPWVLLMDYNSNGYFGAVSDEDKPNFAISSRNIIPDDIILPLVNDSGNRQSYSLEPQFLPEIIEARSSLPWNYASGELMACVTNPDGTDVNIGPFPFTGKKGQWPTTGKTEFTAWKPPSYGHYSVRLAGWIADIWGNKYVGGGTYHFWIAKRMTLATATFQGQAYPVGGRYGRDIGFNPAVPADVEVNAVLYVNSDPNDTVTVSSKGKASPGGIFGSAQGSLPLPLNSPGEYHAHVLATYTDADSVLWVSSMRHAGVVYPTDTPIIAHGKKLHIGDTYVDRGETHLEGYTVTGTDISFLQHLNFPYQAGDVLLIASEGEGSNKIEPVLTYEDKNNPAPYDTKLTTIGASNLKIRTSNGYSPHMFPEYIADWMYYYGAAPRPGFMSRFIVGDNAVRAPYWPTSPNSFGGQIGASNNGDLPGDIYRLIGGVVIWKSGETPRYAGYISSAFLLPKGTNNNRIIGPGAEDVIGSTGEKARFFLVGLRPGMVYETGTSYAPAVQIDPILPVNIKYTVQYPDGRTQIWQGQGDAFGSFAGSTRATLDKAGVYKYWIDGEWAGFHGTMPGLPASGGEFYVIDKDRPAGAKDISLNLPNQSVFDPSKTLTITGASTAAVVNYAVIIPGSIVDVGRLYPKAGRFEYRFDPAAIHQKTPTYDIVNIVNGKTEVGKVVHITFSAQEMTSAGVPFFSFTRVILRGSRIFYTR